MPHGLRSTAFSPSADAGAYITGFSPQDAGGFELRSGPPAWETGREAPGLSRKGRQEEGRPGPQGGGQRASGESRGADAAEDDEAGEEEEGHSDSTLRREKRLELNRRAAQLSRQRKKQRLVELEDTVFSLARLNEEIGVANKLIYATLMYRRVFHEELKSRMMAKLLAQKRSLAALKARWDEAATLGDVPALQAQANAILKIVSEQSTGLDVSDAAPAQRAPRNIHGDAAPMMTSMDARVQGHLDMAGQGAAAQAYARSALGSYSAAAGHAHTASMHQAMAGARAAGNLLAAHQAHISQAQAQGQAHIPQLQTDRALHQAQLSHTHMFQILR